MCDTMCIIQSYTPHIHSHTHISTHVEYRRRAHLSSFLSPQLNSLFNACGSFLRVHACLLFQMTKTTKTSRCIRRYRYHHSRSYHHDVHPTTTTNCCCWKNYRILLRSCHIHHHSFRPWIFLPTCLRGDHDERYCRSCSYYRRRRDCRIYHPCLANPTSCQTCSNATPNAMPWSVHIHNHCSHRNHHGHRSRYHRRHHSRYRNRHRNCQC
mmetsp:Transcript_20235/g.30639  ORF Transcript_20235/g.30639 Transcript_20235/m.30639 type:complete len:210 (+) Transcript_20235:241-870(+)